MVLLRPLTNTAWFAPTHPAPEEEIGCGSRPDLHAGPEGQHAAEVATDKTRAADGVRQNGARAAPWDTGFPLAGRAD